MFKIHIRIKILKIKVNEETSWSRELVKLNILRFIYVQGTQRIYCYLIFHLNFSTICWGKITNWLSWEIYNNSFYYCHSRFLSLTCSLCPLSILKHYQDENLKLVSQQYITWSDCTFVRLQAKGYSSVISLTAKH